MVMTWIQSLDQLNLLATIELLGDLRAELNIATAGEPVAIAMWNPVIKHIDLHPGDTPGIRDAYIERRFKITNFLKNKRVIRDFEIAEGDHRWTNRIVIEADPVTVRRALEQCEADYLRRFPARVPQQATKTSANKEPITRAEWIAIIGVVIAVAGVVAAWLAVPGFQEWVRWLFGVPSLPQKQ